MQALRTWMKRYGIVYFYIAAWWFCNVTYKEFCHEPANTAEAPTATKTVCFGVFLKYLVF